MPKNIIIIGAGGHAKVIADIVLKSGNNLIGFLDDNKAGDTVVGFEVLGRIDKIEEFEDKAEFVIGIGDSYIRKRIAEKYGVKWSILVHPSACVASEVFLGEGTVVMANAVINACTTIRKHCIINSGVIIEHDNTIENYTHISPNATLCGQVFIGECTHVGAGATIINGLCVCRDCIIGAGAVVIRDIMDSGKYSGVPAGRM